MRHALLRSLLLGAIGLALGLPVASPAAAEQPPAACADTRGAALLLGDSNMYGSFGHALTRWFESLGYREVVMKGKPSSGLARPDFFDWALEGGRLVEQHDPEVVIIILGGNDVQRMRPRTGRYRDGVGWAESDTWSRLYRARVRQLLRALTRGSDTRRVFLLSPTNRRSRFLRTRVRRVAALQREVAAEFERVTWIDTYSLSSDTGGRYLAWGLDERGRRVKLRRGDGIHLTKPGGYDLAGRVMLTILPRLDLAACRP